MDGINAQIAKGLERNGACNDCRVNRPHAIPRDGYKFYRANWMCDPVFLRQPECLDVVIKIVNSFMARYDCSDC